MTEYAADTPLLHDHIPAGRKAMRTRLKSFERIAAIAILSATAGCLSLTAAAQPWGKEAQRVIQTILAPPAIRAEPGFKATLLVPPGELYDPLFMVMQGNKVWMNDDGGETDGHGSRILSVAPDGAISVIVGTDKVLPITGFDIAPSSFGKFGGQVFALSQPKTGMPGALANHVIQRIDLDKQSASVFCTLPKSGRNGGGVAGFGIEARFGPPGSGFSSRFFSITSLNRTIYETGPDGSCKPFADLSATGVNALAFTADGSAMLVTAAPDDPSEKSAKGVILRIGADGKVDPKPVAAGFKTPMGLAIAPQGFGNYGGEIFVADAGEIEIPVPQTQPPRHDGKVYRVTKTGELKLVASGFVNPAGLLFVGNHLWVTDINGDFIGGMRELPDGFVVRIDPE
jgi:hypothetical protein